MASGEYLPFQYGKSDGPTRCFVQTRKELSNTCQSRRLHCRHAGRHGRWSVAQFRPQYVPPLFALLPWTPALTCLDIAQASTAASRILDLRRNERDEGRLVSLDIGDLGTQDQGVRIEFRDVWFRYPTRDAPVLNGLNMTVSRPAA